MTVPTTHTKSAVSAKARRRGKEQERKLARYLGGTRTGPLGKAVEDVSVEEWLKVESKEREKLPIWLLNAMRQATEAALRADEAQPDIHHLGAVFLRQLGQEFGEGIIAVRLADWREWFGGFRRLCCPPEDVCRD